MKNSKKLNYTYQEYYEEPSKNSVDIEEEDYIEFLKQHGHKDFSLISFLPNLLEVKQFEQKYIEKFLVTERVQRTQTLIGDNLDVYKQSNNGKIHVELTKKEVRKKKTKSQIQKEKQENQQKQETKKDQKQQKQNLDETEEEVESEILAKRFDFTMNKYFYKINMRKDEYGEKLTAYSFEIGRIVSCDCISKEMQTVDIQSQYNYYDKYGNQIPKPREVIEEVPLEDIQYAFYFQWRIDSFSNQKGINPKIIIGICRENFKLMHDVNKTIDAFCMNLASGDIMTNGKWRDYYPAEQLTPPQFGYFQVGSIIGMLIDMDRGIICFYKDGQNLGSAFVQPNIKFGDFFPFIQTHEPCEISIFHPFVYPAYRPPMMQEEEEEEYAEESDEEIDQQPNSETIEQFPKLQNDLRKLKQQNTQNQLIFDQQDNQEITVLQVNQSFELNPKFNKRQRSGAFFDQDKFEKPNSQQSSSQKVNEIKIQSNISGVTAMFQPPQKLNQQQMKSENKKQTQQSDDLSMEFNDSNNQPISFVQMPSSKEKQKREEFEKNLELQKNQILKDMKNTQSNINKQSKDGSRKSIKVNDIDINLDDLDMNKLTHDQKQDIDDIERLEKEIQNLTLNMTLGGEISEVDKNFSMRPTVLSNSSQRRQINNLQYEIEKYQKEIELLKLKLQFKHQIISYKKMEKKRNLRLENEPNYQTDPCSIF